MKNSPERYDLRPSASNALNPADPVLSRYLPHLSQMSEQLRQTSAQIESSVVEVCNSFQGIAARSKATVRHGRSFLSQGGADSRTDGSFDALIHRCSETLVKLLKTTEASADISRRAMERIRQMDAASEKISAALEQLELIARGNKMMALNARIEAVHAGEKGAGFAVVAVEVASQTERSQKVTAEVSDLVVHLRELAGSTLADLEQMVARDVTHVEQCRTEVNTSLDELRSAHGEMKRVLAGMSEDGEVLSNDISSAIRGMQFQDRVSQRLAHVIEDLDKLHRKISAGIVSGWTDGETSVEDGFSEYTMLEERMVAGTAVQEASGGDVELF